jgi:maltose/moltooligosaccharide transporter
MTKQPQLSFWQIWNMCFGFMGIQFGFALQNANVSRIFQTLGADYNNMTLLWVAAPITGLVVQPIVGYFSDRTWGNLGRRRPYFLYGALLSTAALFVMPNSPSLWIAAGTLWILDASINVSMEPFRALVGDVLPPEQRGFGYAMQSFFIGIGAVVASALPWMMTNWFDVSNTADAGAIPESVKLSFYAGGLIFLAAVSWTVFTTKEYAPEEMASFFEDSADESAASDASPAEASTYTRRGVTWLLVGLIATLVIDTFSDILDRNLYILSLGIAVFGLCQLAASRLIARGKTDHGFVTVLHDLFNMPRAHAQTCRRAVLQLVSTLCHVDIHNGGGDRLPFQYDRPHERRLQPRRRLGRPALFDLQCGRYVVRYSHTHHGAKNGFEAITHGEPILRWLWIYIVRRHPRPFLPATEYGGSRYGVGIYFIAALRASIDSNPL